MSDLPPPPPPVEVPEGAPTVAVPVPTLEWLAARDVYAEEVTAWGLEMQADAIMARAEADASAHLALIHERDARSWERVARTRPRWGLVLGIAGGAALVGAASWEALR